MIFINQGGFFLSGNDPDLNSRLNFYFTNDLSTIGSISHSRSSTRLYMFHFIYFEKKLVALHCLNDLLDLIQWDLAFIKYFESESQRCTDECCFNKLRIALRAFEYIGN